ncbi:MAG: Crp/Fnr family transcriptional regulator [Lactimicrobium sp.]|jgi:CRP/FNR family cyclic AMP-dependent transcriptional regulator|uniref:Crp/Fnr family transcriptional regulator n=1 Tax=Lactimicrobium sp. TaxID=2563780 RepID=UPI002F355508
MNPLIDENYFEELRKCGDVRNFAENEPVYLQQEKADHIYVVMSGRVRIYAISGNGSEVNMEVLRKGRIFGDASLIPNAVYMVSAQAVVPSEILVTDAARMVPVLMQNGKLLQQVLAYLSGTCNVLMRKIMRATFLDAPHALADLLLELSENSSTIPYTHEHLAAESGMNRVTVSRILADFKKHGWIDYSYGIIFVKQRNRLQNYVDTVIK